MNGNHRTPWPRSWPPRWRAVLHIAIATAAGNIVAGVGSVLERYRPKSHELVIPFVFAWMLMPVLVTVILSRATRRTTAALFLAFLAGLLTWAVLVEPLYEQLGHFGFFLSMAAAACAVGFIFPRIARSARPRGVWLAICVGLVLSVLSYVCAYRIGESNISDSFKGTISVVEDLKWTYATVYMGMLFLVGVSLSNFFTLPLAITATLLVRAAEGGRAQRGGDQRKHG